MGTKANAAPVVVEIIPSRGGGAGGTAILGCVSDAVDGLIEAREAGRVAEGQGVRVRYDGGRGMTYREAAGLYRQTARYAESLRYAATAAIRWTGEPIARGDKAAAKAARKASEWGVWVRYSG